MNYKQHIKDLENGKSVVLYPKGYSMIPIINSGDKITIIPIKDRAKIKKNDIVFCKVKNYCIHLVKDIKNGKFQIGDNHGNINGWIREDNLFGLVTRIEK